MTGYFHLGCVYKIRRLTCLHTEQMFLPKKARAENTEPQKGCSISGDWSNRDVWNNHLRGSIQGKPKKPSRLSHWPQEVGKAGACRLVQRPRTETCSTASERPWESRDREFSRPPPGHGQDPHSGHQGLVRARRATGKASPQCEERTSDSLHLQRCPLTRPNT